MPRAPRRSRARRRPLRGSASPAPDASQPGASSPPAPSTRPEPALPGIELTFYPDAAALAAAYRAGDLDAASGLPPELANQLAAEPNSRLLSYPRTTLSAIALNLRPGATELRTPTVRHGLLAAIDRARIVEAVFGGAATRADSPIPPSSWAFDRKASRIVRHDLKRATADLKAAGWKRLRRRLGRAGDEDTVRDGADRARRRVEPDRQWPSRRRWRPTGGRSASRRR